MSFLGEAAELSPDQTMEKPVVRKAHIDPGLCLCGSVFNWDFHASQHWNLLVTFFSGSGLQTPTVQVVWYNFEVMMLYYLAGSEHLDPQSWSEVMR